jgi:hypothetical protein
MAIYRADKAVMTFGTEAAQGGIPEGASVVGDGTGSALIDMATSGLPAGSRSITISNISSITAGEFIQIGPEVSGSGVFRNAEIRRVEHVEGTTKLHLDAPTAFFHPDDTTITVVQSTTETYSDKFMTFIPGVYESIDVPDPEMNIEPKYLLGTSSNRNFYRAYKSSQSYSGGVGSFTLLNGWPLRFPIGKVTTIAKANSSPLTSKTRLATGGAKKGDYYITVVSDTDIDTAGDLIAIDHADSPVSTSTCEVRRVVSAASDVIRLNYPLQFDHDAAGSGTTQVQLITEGTGIHYQHDIWETSDLDTVSWNILLRDSGDTADNDIIRRYYGGMIGGASISASEEGMLTMSWDSIPFLGMNHNQADHTGVSEEYQADQGMPGFSLIQTIDDTDISDTSTVSLKDRAYPSTNPYFFSEGTISMFGETFARVSDFNISIDNSVESRYYLNAKHGKLNRGPSEHREGARSYNMSATLALPDSIDADATSSNITLFKELLLEGDYGTNVAPNHKGFDISLTFTRGKIAGTTLGASDSITITIPTDGTASGKTDQGAFITSATHNIGGSGILSVDVNMFFRNMKIQIKDGVQLYP